MQRQALSQKSPITPNLICLGAALLATETAIRERGSLAMAISCMCNAARSNRMALPFANVHLAMDVAQHVCVRQGLNKGRN